MEDGFQCIWVGAAYFWFFAATLAAARRLGRAPIVERASRMFNGIVGVVAMVGAVALTLYSLGLYLRSYGRVFTGAPVRGRS